MKRIISWLFILTFTFALGAFATFLYIKFNTSPVQKTEILNDAVSATEENASETLQIFDYCELAHNPEKYNGKVVRLSGVLTFGLEGSWFSDMNCGTPDNAAIISSKNEEVWKSIKQAREQNGKFWANQLKVIVVGKFRNEIYKDCCLIAPFQFEILKVEKASVKN